MVACDRINDQMKMLRLANIFRVLLRFQHFVRRFKLRTLVLRSILLLLFLKLLNGCASSGYSPKLASVPADLPDAEQCAAVWHDFQLSVNMQGVFDAQDWPLPGYEFLRLDRAASHLLQGRLNAGQKLSWLELTYDRGKLARQIENHKLANAYDMTLLENCLSRLLPELAEDSNFWSYAHTQSFPDRYSFGRQIFGLYYVFRPVVSWQVKALNERVSSTFQLYESKQPWHLYSLREQSKASGLVPKLSDPSPLRADLQESEATGASVVAVNRQLAVSQQGVRSILNKDQQKNALGLPYFSEAQTRALAEYYHPIIALEFGHEDDRVGRPVNINGEWKVSEHPRLFTSMTYVRWQGQWLPQLVYHWWYPARPKVGLIDILAGELDGLIWRVTLDWNGNVLFYDSIHPCGCYHKVYPATPGIEFRGTQEGEEKLMVLPVVHPGPEHRPVIKISSIAHYVVGLEFYQTSNSASDQLSVASLGNTTDFYYEISAYDDLRWRKSGDQYLFGSDGLVQGTERLERFLLWNMGVVSPGTMRQWGHHATAFVSRRHFDDPMFFETYFELTKTGTK